jgi:hypothetical protein
MKWAPFESYVLETCLEVPDLVARLQSRTEPARVLRLKKPQAEFVGRVSADGFRIRAVLRSGASFAPELHGRIEPTTSGTRVYIDAIPSLAALTVVAALAIAIGMMVFRTGQFVWLAIAGAVLGAWLSGTAGFWMERGAARRKLSEIITGAPHTELRMNSEG